MESLKKIILGQLELGPSCRDVEGVDELVSGVISFLVYNSKDLNLSITAEVMEKCHHYYRSHFQVRSSNFPRNSHIHFYFYLGGRAFSDWRISGFLSISHTTRIGG